MYKPHIKEAVPTGDGYLKVSGFTTITKKPWFIKVYRDEFDRWYNQGELNSGGVA